LVKKENEREGPRTEKNLETINNGKYKIKITKIKETTGIFKKNHDIFFCIRLKILSNTNNRDNPPFT